MRFACHRGEVLAKMRAVEKGISQEPVPVFRSIVAAFAVLTCALSTGAFAQSSAPPASPPPPLMPITLAGDAERGSVIGQTCTGCHGIPGYYNEHPAYQVPMLGAQNADYIEVALQGYRRGTRGHETMQAQASSLSDQDIADVAAYFESFKADAERPRTLASAEKIEAGRAKSATCAACHGAEGVAAAPQWPKLAGHPETYLQEAHERYKTGHRVDLVMNPLIAQLDEQTIEELAAFFATQPHLHNTEP
jgi:cytochrome c553